jgi:hypothetical protein
MNAVPNMTQVDPWEERAWNVLAVDTKLQTVLSAGNKPPRFRLQRRSGSQPAVYALKPASNVDTGLPECFQPSILLKEMGSRVLNATTFPALGEPTTPPHQSFWDVSEQVINDPGATTEVLRLEGKFEIDGSGHTLRMYHVQNLVAGTRAFLVIDIEEDNGGEDNPDGTAIGNN